VASDDVEDMNGVQTAEKKDDTAEADRHPLDKRELDQLSDHTCRGLFNRCMSRVRNEPFIL